MFRHLDDLRNQIADLQRRLNASEALVQSLLQKHDLLQSQLIQTLRPTEQNEVHVTAFLPENVLNAIASVSGGNPSLEAHLGNWARGELALGNDPEAVATRIRLGDEDEPAIRVSEDSLGFIPPSQDEDVSRETDEPEGDE